ncbi:hypothetical protein Btru_009313 [Bulinus truncatus]|nr:hypothetical protein Btru_009313 [Bulinus truncatus]
MSDSDLSPTWSLLQSKLCGKDTSDFVSDISVEMAPDLLSAIVVSRNTTTLQGLLGSGGQREMCTGYHVSLEVDNYLGYAQRVIGHVPHMFKYIIVIGQPVTKNQAKKFFHLTDTVIIGYGSTECFGVCKTYVDEDDIRDLMYGYYVLVKNIRDLMYRYFVMGQLKMNVSWLQKRSADEIIILPEDERVETVGPVPSHDCSGCRENLFMTRLSMWTHEFDMGSSYYCGVSDSEQELKWSLVTLPWETTELPSDKTNAQENVRETTQA